MDYKFIKVEVKNNVGYLIINKPPYNVLDIPTMKEMNNALDEFKNRDDIIKAVGQRTMVLDEANFPIFAGNSVAIVMPKSSKLTTKQLQKNFNKLIKERVSGIKGSDGTFDFDSGNTIISQKYDSSGKLITRIVLKDNNYTTLATIIVPEEDFITGVMNEEFRKGK